MKPVPIMLMSDGPDLPTGLARITRDLALGLSRMPEYRVATFGRGGFYSRRFPWQQYQYPASDQWGEAHLERCWNDFTGGEPGILFTIWDATRLPWLVMPNGLTGNLKHFIETARMLRWGYFPVDGTGPNGKMSLLAAETIRKYDRVLAYGMWAQQLMQRSTGRQDIGWIPHGVNLDLFTIQDPVDGRSLLGLERSDRVIGTVMTNQARKDWGLACRIMAQLAAADPEHMRFWIHTDVLDRSWSLDGLVTDYGLAGKVKITLTGDVNDRGLSALYSACNVTMLPSLGEGFGYTLAESLACGVPIVHGDYAGGAELIGVRYRLPPATFRLDTPYNVMRPVFEPEPWVQKILELLDESDEPVTREHYRRQVEHLNWPNLWPVWEKWFREAL